MYVYLEGWAVPAGSSIVADVSDLPHLNPSQVSTVYCDEGNADFMFKTWQVLFICGKQWGKLAMRL